MQSAHCQELQVWLYVGVYCYTTHNLPKIVTICWCGKPIATLYISFVLHLLCRYIYCDSTTAFSLCLQKRTCTTTLVPISTVFILIFVSCIWLYELQGGTSSSVLSVIYYLSMCLRRPPPNDQNLTCCFPHSHEQSVPTIRLVHCCKLTLPNRLSILLPNNYTIKSHTDMQMHISIRAYTS